MAKANVCFKNIFIFFNTFFAVVGVVLIALTALGQLNSYEQLQNRMTGIVIMYIVGFAMVALASLGAYGAQKNSRCCLIVFLICMGIGTGLLLRAAVPVALAHSEVLSQVEGGLRRTVPLDEAPADNQWLAEEVQQRWNCCGVFTGYQDWGQKIPDSCLCTATDELEDNKCVETSSTSSSWMEFEERRYLDERSRKLVYSQPCGPKFMEYVETVYNIMLGILFGLAALALLGAIMSFVLIVQMRAPVITTPPIFMVNSQPPKYSELFNQD
ncbi:tetraspanin-8 [Chanos chanos]|uniref:Tetraspanin-8 n=1 Tax=Chanos chanos TaxID=29144 RepID=A0A6J2V5Q0_CHACN|nr:tetraspanin-8-like [Chanos chanos]